MPSAKEMNDAVEFLRTHRCVYEGRNVRDNTVSDCYRCMIASMELFGNDDALCDLDSSVSGTWQRLADLIEGKN